MATDLSVIQGTLDLLILKALAASGSDRRRQIHCDLLWALVSSPEFSFNH